MIAELRPYPAMKDSGIPWLGEVPEHWNTAPLKRWVGMNAVVLPETTAPDHKFRYLDIGSVGTGILTQNPQRLRFGTAPSRARRVVRMGDTIVSTVRTYLKAIYFVEEEADELVCSTGFAVLTPRVGTLPKFVSYLAQSNSFTDRVTADSVGIAYPAIAETRLGSFHVAVPPLPEQAAIVRFLDHADRRIRRYIRAKKKLIKLLEEQKQSGQTCPADLKKLASKGVRIYTVQNLHAKAFVFGTKAFIGSANVSHRSAGTLVEAMLATTDHKAVIAARHFVRGLCVQELGPEAIERLKRIYRPPRITGAKRPRSLAHKGYVGAELPRVMLAQLTLSDPPTGSENIHEAGRKVAVKRREKPRRHKLDDFWWDGRCPFRIGDIVVQITDEGSGRKMVSPPASVIHTRTWRRGSRTTTFVYVEVPVRRRITLNRLAIQLGRKASVRLRRGGRVRRDFAERLLTAWSQ